SIDKERELERNIYRERKRHGGCVNRWAIYRRAGLCIRQVWGIECRSGRNQTRKTREEKHEVTGKKARDTGDKEGRGNNKSIEINHTRCDRIPSSLQRVFLPSGTKNVG
ncbi:unnamed protein product, partial [Ectocarpus sp. 12 AP-2014]